MMTILRVKTFVFKNVFKNNRILKKLLIYTLYKIQGIPNLKLKYKT